VLIKNLEFLSRFPTGWSNENISTSTWVGKSCSKPYTAEVAKAVIAEGMQELLGIGLTKAELVEEP
jgi:hypothetical protein